QAVHVVGEALDGQVLHPFPNASHQSGTLVACEVKTAAAFDVLQQGFKFGRDFYTNHRASPATRATRAAEISSRERMKSTFPVWMAAPGMPKNSEVASSWAITVPPIFLMACTPIWPSLPVPVSTTAMARPLKPAATDSKRRSAEGRT